MSSDNNVTRLTWAVPLIKVTHPAEVVTGGETTNEMLYEKMI
jgi:hypothetical protein